MINKRPHEEMEAAALQQGNRDDSCLVLARDISCSAPISLLKVRFFIMIVSIIYNLDLKTSFMIRKVIDLFKTGYFKSSSPNCTV